ncbi:MAG: hypothetical protein P8179_22700 [Candidatus Thiodiazotropha sp.]
MNSFDLGLLPSGHLHSFPSAADEPTGNTTLIASIGKAFTRSAIEGLLPLAARK